MNTTENPGNAVNEPGTTTAPAPEAIHKISRGQFWFTRLVQVPLMAAATAFFGTISLICGLWDAAGRRQHLVARAWAGVMLRIALAPVQVISAERFSAGPAVYAH